MYNVVMNGTTICSNISLPEAAVLQAQLRNQNPDMHYQVVSETGLVILG